MIRLPGRTARRRMERRTECDFSFDARIAELQSRDPAARLIGDITGLTSTFTRASVGTICSSQGMLRTMPWHMPRYHYVDLNSDGVMDEVGLLIETASQNKLLQTEGLGFAPWVPAGAGAHTAAAAVFGELVLDQLNDNSAAALYQVTQGVTTFSFAAKKAVSFFIAQPLTGGAVSSLVLLNSSVTARGAVIVTWAAGVPVLSLINGATNAKAERWGTNELGQVLWRISFTSATVVTAESHVLYIYPATDSQYAVANTGAMLFGGVQVEESPVATSYMKSGASYGFRALDVCYFDWLGVGRPLSVFVDLLDITGFDGRATYWSFSPTTTPRLWAIADNGGFYGIYNNNTAGAAQSTASGVANPRDRIKARVILHPDGHVTAGWSINAAAETVNSAASTIGLSKVAFGTPRLHLGEVSNGGAILLFRVKVVSSVSYSLAQLDALP